MKIKIKSDKKKVKPNRKIESKEIDSIVERLEACEAKIEDLHNLIYRKMK